ncbi:MAG TPA: CYTH domain-containing protein [Rhizomicrobium sp.]|nr:CYTH domain-containing protein [Rhizomicrobium sp.]
MAREIERKFLVAGDGWRRSVRSAASIRQAYLARPDAASIRVRIIDEREAFLTIKSSQPGAVRAEFEYAVPMEDALHLLHLRTGLVIRKRRHIVPAGGFEWEVDVFEDEHAGLVLAELELDHRESDFERPAWIGQEVTGDPRFYNANLAVPMLVGAGPGARAA